MTLLVIDASAAASWLIRAQSTAAADALAARMDDHDFVAPYIFCWEIANVLLRQSRRNHWPLAQALDDLQGFGIRYADPPSPDDVLDDALRAENGRLSLFDAAYLTMAVQLDAPLATRDAALLAACGALGLDHLDLRDPA